VRIKYGEADLALKVKSFGDKWNREKNSVKFVTRLFEPWELMTEYVRRGTDKKTKHEKRVCNPPIFKCFRK